MTPAWSLRVLIHCNGALAVSLEHSCILQHQAFPLRCMQVTRPAPEVRPHTPQRGRSARSAPPCVTLQCCELAEQACANVTVILSKHTACSEGLCQLYMVRPAPDIESSRSAWRAWLAHCTPAYSLSTQLQLHIAFRSRRICQSISLQCLQGESLVYVTRPASGVQHLLLPGRPCWHYAAPA